MTYSSLKCESIGSSTGFRASIAFSLHTRRNPSTYMRPAALAGEFSRTRSAGSDYSFHPLVFKDELIRGVVVGKRALSARPDLTSSIRID